MSVDLSRDLRSFCDDLKECASWVKKDPDCSALRVPLGAQDWSDLNKQNMLRRHFSTSAHAAEAFWRDTKDPTRAIKLVVDGAFSDPVHKSLQELYLVNGLTENYGLPLNHTELLKSAYKLQIRMDDIVENYPRLLPGLPPEHPVSQTIHAYKHDFSPRLAGLTSQLQAESGLEPGDFKKLRREAEEKAADGAETLSRIPKSKLSPS